MYMQKDASRQLEFRPIKLQSMHRKTLVEYFAGIGLFRMALEPLGWNPVLANDISQDKFIMYQGFFSDDHSRYVVEDIFKLDPKSIPNATLATAGFPCIDLSLAGNMNGVLNGRHSSAFWGLIRIFQSQGDISPPFILLENVPGWLSSNDGKDFRITVEALNKIGYSCDVFVLDANRFTPQSRQRIFLLGNRLIKPKWEPSKLEKRSNRLKSTRLEKVVLSNFDLSWNFYDIPEPPTKLKQGLLEIVEAIELKDDRWWDESEVLRHLEMMAPSHRSRVEKTKENSDITYRTFFRRRRNGKQRAEVRKGEIAGCLRTAVGGSSKQFIVASGQGNINMRNMTSREYARLQGVSDIYKLVLSETKSLTGLGDAVCVPAVRWIGEHIIEPLIESI